jgi:hypothetical protein
MKMSKFIPLIVLFTGLVMFALGLLFGLRIMFFVKSAGRVEATVIGQRRIVTINSVAGDRYRPEVVFRTPDKTEIKTELSAAWGEHNRGDIIHVLFDPEQPSNASHDHFWSLWTAPIIFFGAALVSWHAAVLLWFLLKRKTTPTAKSNLTSG